MHYTFLFLASMLALSGVGMGAFGAHALRAVLSDQSMSIYQTAVSYQMWHGLGLGLVASFIFQCPQSKLLVWAGWWMFAGVILFSGSLYALSIVGISWLGAITPFGGFAFIVAWAMIMLFAFRQIKKGTQTEP